MRANTGNAPQAVYLREMMSRLHIDPGGRDPPTNGLS